MSTPRQRAEYVRPSKADVAQGNRLYVPSEVVAERDRALSAERNSPSDLTGDPSPTRSALAKRTGEALRAAESPFLTKIISTHHRHEKFVITLARKVSEELK